MILVCWLSRLCVFVLCQFTPACMFDPGWPSLDVFTLVCLCGSSASAQPGAQALDLALARQDGFRIHACACRRIDQASA